MTYRLDYLQITNLYEYEAALKEIESLMMADPDTPEGEKLDVMVTLIEAYEVKHFPIEQRLNQRVRDKNRLLTTHEHNKRIHSK